MLLVKKPGLKYVARGDPSAYDFSQSTLTQDSAWHSMDLSAIIPANAKLVHLALGAAHATPGRYFKVRKPGLSNDFAVANVATQATNIVNTLDAIVPCVSQAVEYFATSGTFVSLRVVVLGWFV